MHVYNRVAGFVGERPFGRVEKEEFIRRLKELAEFYVLDVIGWQMMSNHFHLLLHIPADPPSNEEAARRYHRRYPHKRPLDPASRACTGLARQLRDVSAFMAELEQPFSRWFNRTRSPRRRRGHLWAERFRNTVLEQGLAVWTCWQYVELNCVRAHLALHPGEYRWGSFGEWCGRGRHPFAAAIERCLLPRLRGLLQVENLEQLRKVMSKAFLDKAAQEAIAKGMSRGRQPAGTTTAVAAEREVFSLGVNRRVRSWVDGLAIGSERFVRHLMSRARPYMDVSKRRLVQASEPDGAKSPLFCFKQLRVLLE
jgi:REP element-mobilizing transposase RayT